MFWVLKRIVSLRRNVSLRRFFWVPRTYVWLINKIIIFLVRTLYWRPGLRYRGLCIVETHKTCALANSEDQDESSQNAMFFRHRTTGCYTQLHVSFNEFVFPPLDEENLNIVRKYWNHTPKEPLATKRTRTLSDLSDPQARTTGLEWKLYHQQRL